MKILSILIVTGFISFAGCANLMRAFVPDSPRPNTKQLETAKEISEKNVTSIAELQLSKQRELSIVARAALNSLSDKSSTFVGKAEAVSNIAANAFLAIEKANGTKDTLGKLQGTTMEDILRMNTMQYMAGIAAQSTANLHNQEVVYSGVKMGWQWTKTNIGLIAGLGSLLVGGGVGTKILTTVSSLSAKRSELLKGQAEAIEDWKAEHPEQKPSWETLKNYLVSVHSKTPLDIPKELNI